MDREIEMKKKREKVLYFFFCSRIIYRGGKRREREKKFTAINYCFFSSCIKKWLEAIKDR